MPPHLFFPCPPPPGSDDEESPPAPHGKSKARRRLTKTKYRGGEIGFLVYVSCHDDVLLFAIANYGICAIDFSLDSR